MTSGEFFLVPTVLAASAATLWFSWGPGTLRRVLSIAGTIIVFILTWLAYVLVMIQAGAKFHI